MIAENENKEFRVTIKPHFTSGYIVDQEIFEFHCLKTFPEITLVRTFCKINEFAY